MGIQEAKTLDRKLGWVDKIRPMVIGAFVAGVLAPERRTIVESHFGLQYFIDPLSLMGRSLVRNHHHEEETLELIQELLSVHGSFLDIGANEGYFSVLAASIVGPGGYVAMVEPQSRLCEIIQINLALNGVKGKIFHGALGGAEGNPCEIYLSPALNTGSSSVLKRPRFSRRSENVKFLDPAALLGDRDEFTMVKIDVEGFEGEVVKSLLPLIERKQIGSLFVEYHTSILRERGIEPSAIEGAILNAGMVLHGNPKDYSAHRLYKRA